MNDRAAAATRDTRPGERAVALALSDPGAAILQADRLLEDTETTTRERARALWAKGLAHRVQNDLPTAREDLVAAVELAAGDHDLELAGRIRSSLALVLTYLGDPAAGLAAIDEAAGHLTGRDAARNDMQRALVLQRIGRHDEADVAYGRALAILRQHDDASAAARLLLNRANLRIYRGDLHGAEGDLVEARQLADLAGDRLTVGYCLQNLAFKAGRAGDIPTALERFDEAAATLRAVKVGARGLAILESDRTQVLADAGLVEEAVRRASGVVGILAASGNRTESAEAELLHARMLLLAGRHTEAAATARTAAARFQEDGREPWAVQARFVILASELALGEPADVEGAADLAEELDAAGWRSEARRGRIELALYALEQGHVDRARRLLHAVGGMRRNASAIARLQHWHATALLREANGDRRAARRAVTAGLRLLSSHRMTFGSAELRAHATAHGRGLVELALRLAIERGRPADALAALDGVRAADTSIPHRPPEDAGLGRALADLRRLDAQVREQLHAGDDVREAERERARVERRVRDIARSRTPTDRWSGDARLDVAALRSELRDRTLVSFMTLGSDLHRFTVTRRGVRHRSLGPLEPISREIATLRFALQRLASATTRAAVAEAARASCERSSDLVDRLLGLGDVASTGGVVVVPSQTLHGLPWGALPSLASRPVTVVPSAQHWRHAAARGDHGEHVVVAAGPDLEAGDREAEEIHALYPDSRLLEGAEATSTAVLAAMENAAVVHLAAHGDFRSDNPMFSSLRWSDGPLTVYDLEHLRDPPNLLVLSSCDAANEQAVAADAVLGMASGLLRLGVVRLIAAVLPIPDESTRAMMHALHERLIAGTPPALALAETCAAITDDNPQDYALRRAFLHFGAST